uniref:SPK domain-containing protein n=1 Tax=Caenorhabditis tropicalis TaxID=1561998 RepID=A0A1I7UFQ9_9PELO
MMESKPFTYQSLKCVLEHMTAEIRIQLSDRCPSLRETDRATLLRIRKLKLNQLEFRINKTLFKLRMTSFDDPMIDNLAIDPYYKDTEFELDDYGIPERSFETVPLPGDIVIRRRWARRKDVETRRIEDHETTLRWFRTSRAIKNEKRLERERIQTITCEGMIAALRRRAAGVPSPYTYFIKLESRRDEYLLHTRKVYEACKYLITKLLGGRQIHVQYLDIEDLTQFEEPKTFSIGMKSAEQSAEILGILKNVPGAREQGLR